MSLGSLLKKDVKLIGGIVCFGILLAWIIAPAKPVQFIEFILYITLAIINIEMKVATNKSNEEKKTVYSLATEHQYIGYTFIFILIYNLVLYKGAEYSYSLKLQVHLFEILCYVAYVYYQKKKKSLDRFCWVISGAFIIAMCSLFIPGIRQDRVLLLLAEASLLLATGRILYKTIDYKAKIEEVNLFQYKIFLLIKCLYHFLGLLVASHIMTYYEIIFLILRNLYGYYLFMAILQSSLRGPWQKLIHEIDDLEEKIYYNAQDRNTLVNLSHELKTPLNVIRSAVDLLKLDINEDSEALKDMAYINDDCKTCIRLIRYMIDINKIKGNYIEPRYKISNLVSLVENVVEAYATVYPEIDLVFNTEEEELYVEVDEELIQRSIFSMIALIIHHKGKLYIEMQQERDLESIRVDFYSDQVQVLREYLREGKEIGEQTDVECLLILNYMTRVLNLHKTHLEDRGASISISFKAVDYKEEESICHHPEENINYLIEQIKLDC